MHNNNANKKYKYYITDESPHGNLLESTRRRKEVLLLIGHLLYAKSDVPNVNGLTETLCQKYHFDVVEMNWKYNDFFETNKYPYDVYFLTEELLPDVSKDAFYCVNICDVLEHFSNSNSIAMLRSITFFT